MSGLQRNPFLSKSNGLKDKKIADALRRLPELYESGAILETRDICYDIVEAINEFERAYDDQ